MFSQFSEGDQLLRWASEIEAGAWSTFRATAGYVASANRVGQKPWVFADRMSSLGHLDVDWDDSQWSVAPPILALSEGMGLVSVLSGWRPGWLTLRLCQWAEEGVVRVSLVNQGADPTAVFLAHDSLNHMEEVAAMIGGRVSFRPSAQLVDLIRLEAVESLAVASPPMIDEDLRYFEPASLGWDETQHRGREGLYGFDIYGRREFRLLHQGTWRKVDRATGQLSVLVGRADLVHWHPQSGDCTVPRAMTLPTGLSLPVVAERAAVAACGLLPAVVGDRRIYRNVSREDAARLCDAVGLELRVEKRPLDGIPAIEEAK